MEKIDRLLVNTLRHLVLSYGGFHGASLICVAIAPDTTWTGTPLEFFLWVGVALPPFWASRRDRGWRMKSPFYRISDETDLVKRVERLEQRSNCVQ